MPSSDSSVSLPTLATDVLTQTTVASRATSSALSNRPTAEQRLPQLDGLRAIAVALVVVGHSVGGSLDLLGSYGVGTFFVLSAYLITAILLRQREAPFGTVVRAFYARRALRIAPAYYVLVLTLLVVGVPAMRESWPWHVLYLSNWQVAVSGVWRTGVTHLWSLSVEEQFYLTWPFLALRTPRAQLGRLCVLLLMLALATRLALALVTSNPARVGLPLPSSFDALAIGALLAWHEWAAPAAWRERATVLRRCLAAGSLLLLGGIAGRALDAGYVARMTGESFGIALVAVWVVSRCVDGRAWRALDRPAVRYLGTISYGIYLWHMPVIWAIRQGVREEPALRAAAAGSVPMLAAVSILSVALASLSWFALERPLNGLKRRFPYAIGG